MTQYLDFYHVDVMRRVLNAFDDFNTALANASNMGLEVPDLVISVDGDPYVRCFYADGEAFVEPLFSPVRDFGER